MIVAVESNFVLEIAFEQEDAGPARRIVELAEAKAVQLVVPSCALAEPFDTLHRRTKKREEFLGGLQAEIRQLARSAPFAQLARTSAEVMAAIATSINIQAEELERTIRRLCGCATVVPLTTQALEESFNTQRMLNLAPQDALVFASVDIYLRAAGVGPKLFVNKDRRGFLSAEVQSRLDGYGCRVIPEFDNAVDYIESQI